MPVLARIETDGGSPDQMQRSATAAFDPKPHRIDQYFQGGPRDRWMRETPDGTRFEDWAQSVWLPSCGYWYLPDLADRVLRKLRPRRVGVMAPPSPAMNSSGSIEVHARATEPGFLFSAVDYLMPAVEVAVAKKREKDQMSGYDGMHWLAVAVEGNAATQLGEACPPEEPGAPPDLSGVQFDGYDELWVIGCTFHDWQFAVARFSEPGQQPALCTVPRPPKTELND